MNILVALGREEKKLEKQLGKLQHQLDGVRAAAKALGHSAGREVNGVGRAKKRHFSASARAKMSKAQKARWAKATGRKLSSAKKHVLSAAGREAISKAAKRRWAKAKAQAKKAAA